MPPKKAGGSFRAAWPGPAAASSPVPEEEGPQPPAYPPPPDVQASQQTAEAGGDVDVKDAEEEEAEVAQEQGAQPKKVARHRKRVDKDGKVPGFTYNTEALRILLSARCCTDRCAASVIRS